MSYAQDRAQAGGAATVRQSTITDKLNQVLVRAHSLLDDMRALRNNMGEEPTPNPPGGKGDRPQESLTSATNQLVDMMEQLTDNFHCIRRPIVD